jgi:Platelet-activating factor acetylhydrolase, isoform II
MFRRRSVLGLQVMFLFLLLSVVGVLPLAAQQADWLPAPTGPYQVGTVFYHWVDEARDEVFTLDPNDKRELIVRFWYPAEVEAGTTPVTYFPYGEVEVSGFVAAQGEFVASVPTEEVAQTPTDNYLDVPVSAAQSSYPVLIYSPGLPGTDSMATAHLQELASHGYIIAAINYPYISGWTVFPDGHMVISSINDSLLDLSLEVGAQDQVFVLDHLEELNTAPAGERFSGRLELDHIGTFGASWGAWATAMGCLRDSRFSAALLEGPHGTLPDPVVEVGLDLPIMILDPAGEAPTVRGFSKMRGPAYRLDLNGVSGLNMADFLLWPGMADTLPIELLGVVTPTRSIQVVNAYALAFFDRYLKGEAAPLLDGSSPDFPEVEIETRNM